MKTLAIASALCFPLAYLGMLLTLTGRTFPWMMGANGLWLLWGTFLYTRRQGWWELSLIVMPALGLLGLWFLMALARSMSPI